MVMCLLLHVYLWGGGSVRRFSRPILWRGQAVSLAFGFHHLLVCIEQPVKRRPERIDINSGALMCPADNTGTGETRPFANNGEKHVITLGHFGALYRLNLSPRGLAAVAVSEGGN